MTEQESLKFFELHYKEIEGEIEKRRRKWQLKGVMMFDFDDVKYIVLAHIYKKLHLYDENQPLLNWVNTITTNQIYNILRNNYYSHSRPCLQCACSLPDNGCELFAEQCSVCPIYKKWEQTKKSANDIRMALPAENHSLEIYDIPNSHYDITTQIEEMHTKMKKCLKPFEYKIYDCLFIQNLSEEQTAKALGYSSKEKWRKPGYNSISKAKKIIIEKARKITENGEIDMI